MQFFHLIGKGLGGFVLLLLFNLWPGVSSLRGQNYIQVGFSQPPLLEVDAGSDSQIQAGGEANLGGMPTAHGGTPPYTYLWQPATAVSNITAPNPTATPQFSTTYSITVVDARACTSADQVFVQVTNAFPEGLATEVAIFPNPALQSLSLSFKGPHNYSEYRITDQSGRLVQSGPLPPACRLFTIPIHHLAGGTYQLSLLGPLGALNQTFIRD